MTETERLFLQMEKVLDRLMLIHEVEKMQKLKKEQKKGRDNE